MTDTIKGLNVKVEVATVLGSPVTVGAGAVTKAYPPVVTLAAHGLLDGAVGFFLVTDGMVELDQQAFMVNNKATNTFEIPGLDSANYSTFTTGTYTMGTTWQTVAESAAYAVGGGASAQLDDTRLFDVKTRNLTGLLAAQDLTIDVKNAIVSGTGMKYIERCAQTQVAVLMRITQAGKTLRVAYGVPSLPGEQVSSGQLASGQFGINVAAFCLKPNV